MSQTLYEHICKHVRDTLSYPGAWMVWCDPRNDWGPLLQMAATSEGKENFALISVEERTAGQIGSPLWRHTLQERLDAGQSFVLHVVASGDELGWLWAQALMAQEVYTESLRTTLRKWGWRSQSISIGEDEVSKLARLNFRQDPATWGGGGLQPRPHELLNVLAGGAPAAPDDRIILDLTIDAASLPALDEQHMERWRTIALAHLLVTQAHHVSPRLYDAHDYLVPPDKRAFALDLLTSWLDSVRLSKGLAQRILDADRILTLGHAIERVTIADTATEVAFLSQAAERALFARTCFDLAEKSGLDLFEALIPLYDALALHARGFWGDTPEQSSLLEQDQDLRSQIVPWGELARLSRAARLLLDARPRVAWNTPDEALQWYVQSGWQIEQAGEEIMRHLSRANNELITLIQPLREAYHSLWEEYVIQWSDLWTKAGCPVPKISSQGEWLREQLKGNQSTAVLVVDALRYDIGMGIKEGINSREGAERAQITHARTALPTITALGMGMALPLSEQDLHAEIVNGKWQLYHKKEPALNLALAEQRREWLKTQLKLPPEALLTIEDIENGKVPEPRDKLNRLFIFDNLLDKLGHDDELQPLGTGEVQKRYLRTIEHLHEKRWGRVVIVTDHGFMHWPALGERRVSPPLPNPAYSSRRALAYPADVTFQGPQALAPGKKWLIAAAAGASCFRTYGGLVYYHGGASLQEWIVPCIKIEWPGQAKPVDVGIQAISQILSQRPKIVLEVKRAKLFDNEEALARQVEVRILETRRNKVLFTSQPRLVTPDQDLVSVMMELAQDAEADRNTPLTIQVLDARTHQLITTASTTLMVVIENW